MSNVTDALAALGFTLTETGGGCKAYVARHEYHALYLTSGDGAAPESLTDAVTLSRYEDENGEPLNVWEYASLAEFLALPCRVIQLEPEGKVTASQCVGFLEWLWDSPLCYHLDDDVWDCFEEITRLVSSGTATPLEIFRIDGNRDICRAVLGYSGMWEAYAGNGGDAHA